MILKSLYYNQTLIILKKYIWRLTRIWVKILVSITIINTEVKVSFMGRKGSYWAYNA